jgi:hypothetical protein
MPGTDTEASAAPISEAALSETANEDAGGKTPTANKTIATNNIAVFFNESTPANFLMFPSVKLI